MCGGLQLVAQSICTHYFSFEKLGRFADLKKTGSVCGPEKNRVCAKKQGLYFFVVQKEKRQPVSSLLDCKLQAEKIRSRP